MWHVKGGCVDLLTVGKSSWGFVLIVLGGGGCNSSLGHL